MSTAGAPETSAQRPEVSARVGRWLGIAFAVAFVTGLISHWAQLPRPWVPFPTSPAWGYRVTQGLHVVAGTAAVPLLLIKLWSVFPRFFARPRLRVGSVVLHLLERVSVGVLVASAIFMLATGLANSAQWYPWLDFSFRSSHYAVAWVAIGALCVHIGVKLPVIREALAGPIDAGESPDRAVSRRALVRSAYLGAGLAVLATAGQSVPWLRRVSVLAVRSGEGPQGIRLNRTAAAAGIEPAAISDSWRMEVVAGERRASLSLAELSAMTQHEEELPIACVEGWSASGVWRGVRVRDLLALVDAPAASELRVVSLQQRGAFSRTWMPAGVAADPRTLVALSLAGEPLSTDHGFPARMIAPNRPGVLQTKWVTRLEVV